MKSWIFGRGPGADIVIPDQYASPRHTVAMQADDGSVYVSDLGSTNGTWIIRRGLHRRERVRDRSPLFPGDTLVIGRTHLPWKET